MGGQLKLDYFYGNEPDNFCFYRIPKVLFTKAYFEDLSTDAKLLYGLMLDMMSSSRANRWIDKENRVFIQFSIQRAMAYLNCGKDKAIKLFAELDTEKGIGLIERIDRGQGKADLIYVKSFEIPQDAEDNARVRKLKERHRDKTLGQNVQKSDVDNSPEVVGKTDRFGKSEGSSYGKAVGIIDQSEKSSTLPTQKAVEKTDRSGFPTSRSLDFRPQEVGLSDPNNTDSIYNDFMDNVPVPSYPAGEERMGRPGWSRPIMLTWGHPGTREEGRQDGHDLRSEYINMLKNQVGYEELSLEYPYSSQMNVVDAIINIIADIATTEPPDGCERINGRPYSHEVVKSRLLKMDHETIRHVLRRFRKNGSDVHNWRNYLLTALYNARDEMDLSIRTEVNRDMYGMGGRL